jgi:hypothetical protein
MTRSPLASLVLLAAFAVPAHATTILFSDFSSTTGLVLNGNTGTTVTGDGTVLRLVGASGNQSGSAFSKATINASTFSTFFKFRLTNPGGISDGVEPGADGFVFVVQPVSSSIGGAGGGLGYSGISPSVGVEFDTFQNAWDPSTNHAGIDENGDVGSVATVNVPTKFDDGNLWYAWIDYNGTTLEVRFNQTGIRPSAANLSQNIDIASIIGTNTAFVGFTAGTGAAWENHDIVSWQYNDSFSPINNTSTAPEPTTLALFGSGLVLVTAVSRRRRRTS